MKLLLSLIQLFLISKYVSSNFIERCTEETTIVICTEDDKPVSLQSSNLTVSNCKFVDCPPIFQNASSYLIISNTTFLRSSNLNDVRGGGAILSKGYLILDNVTFDSCFSFRDGAAISSENGFIYGSHVTFENNTSLNDGVIKADNTSIVLADTKFFSSNVSHWGGDMLLINSDLVWKTGGSYYFFNLPHNGGSIYLQNSTAHIEDITMANKSVKNGGGGIYATTNSKLTLKNVEMFNMTSRYGSAITCLYNSDLHCDDCRLHSSTASNYGGFVMGWLSSTLNFTNSKFIGATADTSGGCFSSVWETTVIITNSKLSNCKSSLTVGSGGAMSSDTTSKFHIDNVLISNSSSYSGGAMYNLGHSVIKNSTFNDNFATGSGGAIYDAGFSVYTDIIIANNTAQVGGGIYTQHDSSVPVRTVTFEGTLVVTGNRADLKGGGFAFESQTIVNLSTSEMKISNNIAHSNIGSSILFGQKKAQLLEGDIIYTGPNNSSIDILKFSTDDDYGQVWFEDLTFASKIKKSGVLDVLNIKAFSPPYSVKLKDVSFNNTKVGEMGNITKIEVFAIDALGNTILNINASRPIVVKVFLSNTSNLKLFGESLKGIINNDTKTAVFDNLVISGLTTASTTEEIVIAPVVLKRSDDIIDHPKLRFIIPFCDPDTSAHYNVTTDALGSVSTVCLPKKSVTQPVKIAFFIVSLVLIFCGTVFGIYAFHNRRMSIYRIASPSFTSLITFGCILQFFSVAISIQTGDTQCILIQWVEVLGFMTVALSIILKTYRLKKILINNSGEINARKKSLSDYHLLKWFTLFIFLTIVFLILWTTLDTPYINLRLMDADESWLQEDHCKGDLNIFPSLVATSFILIYLIASVLAFIIRDIPSHFNESKELAMISYQYIILSAIFFPLSTFLQISENFSYICNAVRVLLPTSVTLAFLHVPRMYISLFDVEKATASLKELSRTSNGRRESKKKSVLSCRSEIL